MSLAVLSAAPLAFTSETALPGLLADVHGPTLAVTGVLPREVAHVAFCQELFRERGAPGHPVALGLGWVVDTVLEQVSRHLLVELVRQFSGVGPSGVTVGRLLAPGMARRGVSSWC